MSSNLKNPKQIYANIQKQSFLIKNELTQPEYKDGSEPLTFHHEKFSRFTIAIINEQKRAVTANIPVSLMWNIVEKSKMLAKEHVLFDLNKQPVKTETNGIAYTITISAGRLKGKTPAQALIESTDNEKLLLNQVEWLKQNLARYPKNQQQIDAIHEALQLYKAGSLSEEISRPVVKTCDLYASGLRPLIRRKRTDGKSFVYNVRISWQIGEKKPVCVEITNFYAPVKQVDGLLNVIAREKSDEVKNTFYFTEEEWMWACHIIETNIHTFEMLHAGQNYKVALESAAMNSQG